MISSHTLIPLFPALALATGLNGHCPPLGPVLPAPHHPSTHPSISTASTALRALLDDLTTPYQTSALAIGVKSIHEPDLLFEYTHTPPQRDAKGVQQVDRDTVFRLGSLSKVFAPLALLMLRDRGVRLDDSVTKYVPELKGLAGQARDEGSAVWEVDWEEVTLGGLASHMAGIPSDLITDITPFVNQSAYGYPETNSSRLLGCAGFFGTPACNKTAFFKHFGQRPPVQVPFSPQTVYSNIAFPILSFVVEAVTNQSYVDFVHDNIWKPTNMTRTFASKPDDSLGFIPANDIWWPADLGFEGPNGGYFSTLTDLHRLADAILHHRLLPPTQTRKWLKPVTATSSTGLLIGQPWEIFRAENITSDGRLIELYTKTGDLISYHAILVLIPDYDLVVTVLVAGPGGVGEAGTAETTGIMSRVVEMLVPAVEEAGKAEAEGKYAGRYVDRDTNSSLTFAVDNDGPGLAITEYVIRGVDVPSTDPGSTLPPATPPRLDPPMRYRLYPATGSKSEREEAWRAVGTRATAEEVEARDGQLVWGMGSCVTWAMMDRVTYNLLARDHFVFGRGGNGRVRGVEAVGYGVRLEREGY
ncbi:beta-lactamase-like protein 2 [Dichotomopilus funicola]|uniref:Beta-lactamase-like protein 2 n=1 Tax=Dichotomopilus funicola TaxID=1934379 RepID=A0AAN6ZNA8_9PEZI|nr:beta-lactamase-like protein 2 [Dichotomopilus funicola]